MSYNLRSTSYFGQHLDRELTKRGARTSGSTDRKQARLQRFMDMETKLRAMENDLRHVLQVEQRAVQERVERRSARLAIAAADKIWAEKGTNGIDEIAEMLTGCSPRVRSLIFEFVGL